MTKSIHIDDFFDVDDVISINYASVFSFHKNMVDIHVDYYEINAFLITVRLYSSIPITTIVKILSRFKHYLMNNVDIIDDELLDLIFDCDYYKADINSELNRWRLELLAIERINCYVNRRKLTEGGTCGRLTY